MVIAVVRTVILYLLIIFGIRLLGKHQVGELEPAEFVLALIIADIASVPMQDYGIPLLMGVIPIITLLCLSMILSMLSMKNLRLRALLTGVPSILVRNGKLDQREMRRTRMTVDEILEQLRLQGYTDLADVQYAILETNGQLSVLPYAGRKPPAAEDMDVQVPDRGLPIVLINDGRLLSHNLKKSGLNETWLNKRLAEHKLHSVKQVYLMTVDEQNQTCLIPKELN
ncbi:MAG: DUF421 domain-containing protein [Oscillospiraceae bacterium]|nr:DUF421 domain-containing protein [Oscillospiraceae bacterium]MCD7928321.1 DUF421 domain-containing protein [Oscillospiraceae bacterium]